MTTGALKDVYEGMEGYVGPTHWARPYFSNHHHENPGDMKMLGHVNCGYLSTAGRPPTLEALKRHAQSLAYLISTIAPSLKAGEIDNANLENRTHLSEAGIEFGVEQAYDWLDNLQEPYDNIDKAHRKPLNSLVNLIKRNSDEKGVEFHCPLSEVPIKHIEHELEPLRPFQTHMTLLMHANECLERLDHEYSAMGGLLGILPTEEEEVATNPDLPKARQTFVGQWIMFTQHLVGRMHELEIAYANSLDILANEAIVPAQHLSMSGPDGRSGREIVFPQDRWILANAGEDVFNFIHQMLDKKEAWLATQDNTWVKQNVVGAPLRRKEEKVNGSDEDLLRGIAHVDLSTRYYRLNGSGHGPIFCLPAFSDRPNTQYTKEMENRPTVVTVPEPSAPDRTTAWDKRNKELEDNNGKMFIELSELRKESINLKTLSTAHEEELKRLQHLNKIYEQNQGQDASTVAQKIAEAEAERNASRTQYEENSLELKKVRDELSTYKAKMGVEQAEQPPAGVTKRGENFILNLTAFREYQSRSAAVVAAKPEIERIRTTLQELADKGQVDMSTFAWLDTITNAA
ncbi:hypothetical protein F4781DRAFT_220589 [Annulohypoxylon bovei var. microspora]|nr:hypothetical protein F4781DRAFT_220589 [Annulohypoxylon bovei var. microspora]